MEPVGMILCGGYGKRLFPLTSNLPKVLLEIEGGYTLLDYQLSLYRKAGVKKVYLLAGYLADEIRRRYGEEHGGIELEYVVEEKPLGTLNALRLGMREAGTAAIASNGDVVTDFDLRKMWEDFQKSDALASVLAVRMRSPFGVLRIKGKRILSFAEKPLLPHYINGGFYCLSPSLLPLMEKIGKGNIEQTLFPELAERGKLRCYQVEPPFWVAVDTLKDLEEVRNLLSAARGKEFSEQVQH
jgi:NDP-sugar pyrophosphorylase family protein